MVDIMDKIQSITEIGKTTSEKQKNINIKGFLHMGCLIIKYDILETISILRNFIDDNDLKFIVGQVTKVKQVLNTWRN